MGLIGLLHKIKSHVRSSQSTSFVDAARAAGVLIGENCAIYSPLPCGRDSFLLEIGNNVTISFGVSFILHDNAIIKPTKGAKTDLLGKIIVGDHCFIGANSILIPGVSLAEQTIVGAGSVVTRSVSTPGLVIAGNPAKIVGTVDSYLRKNANRGFNLNGKSMDEIKQLVSQNENRLIVREDIGLEKK